MTRNCLTLNHDGTKAIDALEHSELYFLDPVQSRFRNERHSLEANRSTLRIFYHSLRSSLCSHQLRDYVSQHGCLYDHDAAETMRDMIVCHGRSAMHHGDHRLHKNGMRRNAHINEPNWKLKKYHEGLVSMDSIVTRERQSIGKPFQKPSRCHTPHYNWAFGVLLCLMLCGPPRNNDPQWYVHFQNSLQMGVQVVPLHWFGSSSNRRKWKELEVKTKREILRLTHSESEICADACQTEVEWLSSLNDNLQGSSKTACQGCVDVFCETALKTMLFKQPCPVTEECHQFLFDKEKVLCGPVYNAITKADNDEKAHTRDQLNGFWSKTARNEKKKRRKPLIMAESRERKVKKLKSEIIHRMNSLDKPVVPLIKKLKEMDPSGSYTV